MFTAMVLSSFPSSAVEFVSILAPRFFAGAYADGVSVYIFVGSILLHDNVLRIIAGSVIGIFGVAYVALEFVPSIEPPSNMRETDQSWGAEQV
jgi:hypothetical protein